MKEQNAALGKLKVQAQEQAANARRLQERYDTADRFAQMLRCAVSHGVVTGLRAQLMVLILSVSSTLWTLLNQLTMWWDTCVSMSPLVTSMSCIMS